MTEIPPLTQRSSACPFDPDPTLTQLRTEAPLTRMTFPDGHLGWLTTSHAIARSVLADDRFSARSELQHSPLVKAPAQAPPAAPGMFIAMDPPRHTRYRHLLIGQFTVRRMRRLTERLEQITAQHLDAMAAHGPGVDLVPAFALPIPALVISELLGVADADRTGFQADVTEAMRTDLTPQQQFDVYTKLMTFMAGLVQAKHGKPGDDLLSDLIAEGQLDEEELVNVAFLLLTAGHETTANMLALGTFALLRHPEALAALRDGTVEVGPAVEELLRYLSIIPATVRTALADLELAGQHIAAGESVAISIPVVNRDPAHFTDPDTLDLHHRSAGHLAFGYGVHQCLGQQLARVEMTVALPALLRRFPTLRLAVPVEEIPMRGNMVAYGVHRLPVAW